MISAGILGLGTYLPEKCLTNTDIAKFLDTSDEWIRTRTGISERRQAEEGEATSDMGTKAAQIALTQAGISAEEIDLIIVATVTPDMLFPATACIIQDALHAHKAAAFDLEAGCSGFIYAATVATQFIATGMYRYCLIIGAETLSRVLDWEDRNTCVLFGDGAGAAVMGPVEDGYGILASELGSDGSGGKHLHMPAGGSRAATTTETLQNRLHYLKMNGKEVFKFAVKTVPDTAERLLVKAGLTKKDVDWFIPHQANTRIVEAAMKRLEQPMEKAYMNIDRYGNMSGASIPVAMAEAVAEGKLRKGDTVLSIGFGTGLTYGGLIIKWAY